MKLRFLLIVTFLLCLAILPCLSLLIHSYIISSTGEIGYPSPPPPPSIEERKLNLLTILANCNPSDVPNSEYWEENSMIATSRMYLDVGDLVWADNWFKTLSDRKINDWNWLTQHLIRAYYGLYDKLSQDARDNLYSKITYHEGTAVFERWGNTYLYDIYSGKLNGEPVNGYGRVCSENHDLLVVTAFYFGNQLLHGEDTTFNKQWLLLWMSDRGKRGFLEINSPSYQQAILQCLFNLRDFAVHADIRQKAQLLLDWIVAELAVQHINGYRGGPFHRHYSYARDDQARDAIYNIAHVYFGTPLDVYPHWTAPTSVGAAGHGQHTAIMCTSNYVPRQIVLDIAEGERGTYVLKEKRNLFYDDPPAYLPIYFYVTPHFVLASSEGPFKTPFDHKKAHCWDLSFDTSPRKLIFVGPFDDKDAEAVQYKNVLISESGTINYVGAPYDEQISDSGWTFIREGGTYVAIRALSGGRILLEARVAEDYPSFADFQNDIKDNPLSQNEGVTYTSTLGDVIESPSQYELIVNGVYQDFTAWTELFGSPYLQSVYGSGHIVITWNGQEVSLDF